MSEVKIEDLQREADRVRQKCSQFTIEHKEALSRSARLTIENHQLRTRLAEVEADNAAMIQVVECAGSHDHSDGDEKDCVLCAAVNSVLDHPHPGKSLLERLKEAEWLVQNLVATDTFAAIRRDTFLNPTNKDVK